jgi:hypothetical protein
MAKIKFARASAPVCSVEFARNPSPGDYNRTIGYKQPMDYSVGGDPYIYDKGLAQENVRTLHWRNISATDYANFLTFLGLVVGAKYGFTFTDTDGSTATARIINPNDIQSAPVVTGRESLTVKIRYE